MAFSNLSDKEQENLLNAARVAVVDSIHATYEGHGMEVYADQLRICLYYHANLEHYGVFVTGGALDMSSDTPNGYSMLLRWHIDRIKESQESNRPLSDVLVEWGDRIIATTHELRGYPYFVYRPRDPFLTRAAKERAAANKLDDFPMPDETPAVLPELDEDFDFPGSSGPAELDDFPSASDEDELELPDFPLPGESQPSVKAIDIAEDGQDVNHERTPDPRGQIHSIREGLHELRETIRDNMVLRQRVPKDREYQPETNGDGMLRIRKTGGSVAFTQDKEQRNERAIESGRMYTIAQRISDEYRKIGQHEYADALFARLKFASTPQAFGLTVSSLAGCRSTESAPTDPVFLEWIARRQAAVTRERPIEQVFKDFADTVFRDGPDQSFKGKPTWKEETGVIQTTIVDGEIIDAEVIDDEINDNPMLLPPPIPLGPVSKPDDSTTREM